MKAMKIVTSLVVAALLAGCAARPPALPPPAGEAFTGEVWTWSEPESTVTLRVGDRTIRVKVTPEQLAGLQLHQVTTVRGTLAPPPEILRTLPAPPMVAQPRGPVVEAEITGSVAAVEADGRVSITSARGLLHVWAAEGAAQRLPVGSAVRVQVKVQAVEMVEVAAPAPPPPATPGPAPGDYAVVTGRVIQVDPAGTLVVDSPRGPVQVWVAAAGGHRIGDTVQVHTAVLPVR